MANPSIRFFFNKLFQDDIKNLPRTGKMLDHPTAYKIIFNQIWLHDKLQF